MQNFKKFILFFSLCFVNTFIQAQELAIDIVKAADQIRMPQMSFVVNVILKDYQNGSQIEQTSVTTHSRINTTGQFSTIVHINSPANDYGKLLLRNDNLLWMYDPKSKASVRISPRQRLMGNVSTGDIISSNFSLDYSAETLGKETLIDGDKQERPVWKLKLLASNSLAAYHEVVLWVDKENYRPLKGEFFAQSGRRINVVWYRGWESILGELRPTELVVIDGVNSNKVSVVKMRNYHQVDLPASWFNKEWLPQFKSQQ